MALPVFREAHREQAHRAQARTSRPIADRFESRTMPVTPDGQALGTGEVR